MSDITNPPLEPPTGAPASANHHTSGPIVNPPLERAHSSSPSALDRANPPLEGGRGADGVDAPANPALVGGTDLIELGGPNPPPDEADIERWFAEQLRRAAAAAPSTKSPAKKPRAAKKRAANRTATKQSAATRPAKKPAKKKASRRRTSSKS